MGELDRTARIGLYKRKRQEDKTETATRTDRTTEQNSQEKEQTGQQDRTARRLLYKRNIQGRTGQNSQKRTV